ncbi:MAG: hypothetical protein ACXWC4_03865 [Telluria sp.]
MTRLTRLIAWLCLPVLLLAAGLAGATNYSLWINGRNGNGAIGNYDDFAYWGPASAPAGVNKKAVNWDGYHGIAEQNGIIRAALDCFCTGQNWCYIATHSAGDLMIGYALAEYGGSAREIQDATPDASGACHAVPGAGTQVGWNIKFVMSAASSAGGTELADVGRWTTGEPLVHDHKVARARSMYNHNETRNVMFYMYTGAVGNGDSWLLPGDDDKVVAYHSSAAVAGANGGAYCNWGSWDWWCTWLTLGMDLNTNGWPKWANHWVVYRDDSRTYDHYTNGRWEGPVSMVRYDMQNWAQ